MNETDKLITDQFNRLPKALQDALNTVPWKSQVNEISLLKTLSLEQVEAIERETMFIIYGFEDQKDYVLNMMQEGGIDESTATTIADIINEKIFKEISDIAEQKEKISNMTTTETKEQAMERLSQRMRGESPRAIEVVPPSLPMIEEGEVAHSVPHVELPQTTPVIQTSSEPNPQTPLSATKYVDDKDPYREPLV